jgi:hypothetical protein
MYGYDAKEGDDEWVASAERVRHAFFAGLLPGAHPVNMFPWRTYFVIFAFDPLHDA